MVRAKNVVRIETNARKKEAFEFQTQEKASVISNKIQKLHENIGDDESEDSDGKSSSSLEPVSRNTSTLQTLTRTDGDTITAFQDSKFNTKDAISRINKRKNLIDQTLGYSEIYKTKQHPNCHSKQQIAEEQAAGMEHYVRFLKNHREKESMMNINLYADSNASQSKKKGQSLAKKCCNWLPQNPKFSYKGKIRKAWDLVPIFLSLYNAFVIPYTMSFGELSNSIYMTVIEDLIDIVFLCDLLLMFRTTQKDHKGQEIFDNYEVYLIYTKTWRFKSDFLSMMGNALFVMIHPSFKYLSLLKITRVFRMSYYIMQSEQTATVKTIAKIIKLSVYQFFYLHWLSCVTNLVIMMNAPTEYLYNESQGVYMDKDGT